jgi:hypothetical protein
VIRNGIASDAWSLSAGSGASGPAWLSRIRADAGRTLERVARLLALCEQCSTVFTADNIIGGSGDVTFTLTDTSVGPCPNCGGMGRVPDGDYRMVKDTVQLLRGRSPEQLLRLVNVLQTYRDAPDLDDRVRTEVPELAAALQQDGTVDWKFWLPVLVAVLLFLLGPKYASMFEKPDPSLQEIVQILEREASPTSAPTPEVSNKTPRNAPCPCGSGRKFKRCHGAHPTLRPTSIDEQP